MSVRQHLGLLLLVSLVVAGAIRTAHRFDIGLQWVINLYVPMYLNFLWKSVVLMVAAYLLWLVVVLRPARPVTTLIGHVSERFRLPERLAQALPVIVMTPFFAGAFTTFKSTLGIATPFAWDAAFADWDATLHFGNMPWVILQPVVGYPVATWTLMFFYNLWFFVLAIFWFWQTFSLGDKRLRLQFFYTLLLAWTVLGVVAAHYFASAGPCYFGRVTTGADPFAPLMSYLYDVDERYPLWALRTQEALWDIHASKAMTPGSGISAMPSVHVATALLFFLAARRTGRWVGRWFLAYFVLILIGSVHLGWHYAIDGYASVVAVLPLWWLGGRLSARSMARDVPRPL